MEIGLCFLIVFQQNHLKKQNNETSLDKTDYMPKKRLIIHWLLGHVELRCHRWKYVEGKGNRTIYKQLDVPEAAVALTIQTLNVHRTASKLPGCGCKWKIADKLKRWIILIVPKESTTTSKQMSSEPQGQGMLVSDHSTRQCLNIIGWTWKTPEADTAVKKARLGKKCHNGRK